MAHGYSERYGMDPKKQDRGSAEPVPGLCGAKLKWSDPPRYCMRRPIRGRNRCKDCGGKTLIGPAHPGWKGGGKYGAVLPATMRKHFNLDNLKTVLSCQEEMALIDARVAEVLEDIHNANPTKVLRNTRRVLHAMRAAIADGNTTTADSLAQQLESLIGQTAAVSTGWDEIHRLFDSRAKLARTELGYQELMSKRIMLQHLDLFVHSLIDAARELTDEPKKLNAYVHRVMELGTGLIGKALLEEHENAVIDGEAVDEDEEESTEQEG